MVACFLTVGELSSSIPNHTAYKPITDISSIRQLIVGGFMLGVILLHFLTVWSEKDAKLVLGILNN